MCYRTGKHCCIKTLSTEHRCVIGPENTVASKRLALNIDVLKDRKIHCLQARPCIFQPGHFRGSGSEGVRCVCQSPSEIKRRGVRWTLTKKLDSFAGPGQIKRREVVLDPQVSPEEIKSREVVLDPQESPEEIKSREVVLDPQESPEEIKSREVDLGWIFLASVVPQQQCYGRCPCDCSAQQLKQQLRNRLVATQWRGPHRLSIGVLAVVGLLSLPGRSAPSSLHSFSPFPFFSVA